MSRLAGEFHSDDSDDEFDDTSWNDPSLLASLDTLEQTATQHRPPPARLPAPPSRAPVVAPAKRPLGPPVRQPQAILRPPQPPAKKQRLDAGPAPQQPAFVQPNRAPPAVAGPSLRRIEDEDEDMPEISVGEGGYDVVRSAEDNRRAAGLAALDAWGMGGANKVDTRERSPAGRMAPPPAPRPVPQAPAPRPAVRQQPPPPPVRKDSAPSGAGLEEAGRRELERLRAENAKLAETLKESMAKVEEFEKAFMGKSGEVSIIRGKLSKAEKLHQMQIEEDRKVKRDLEERLEQKEKELKRESDKFAVETAFRRQETETSAKRPGASQWSSSRRPRSTSTQPGFMGPPPFPFAYGASPSLGRTRAPSQRPTSSQKNTITGFQNSFDLPGPASSAGGSRRGPRGDMASPATSRGRGLTTPERKVLWKGKGKMLTADIPEEDFGGESEESIVVDSNGVNEWGARTPGGGGGGMDDSRVEDDGGLDETRAEEYDDDGVWMQRERSADVQLITSAMFGHKTFVHFDTESVTLPATASQRLPTFSLSMSMSRTASTARFGSTAQSTGRLDLSSSQPPPPTTPIPTFHFLTSLRLPPGTPIATIAGYDDICRDLSGALGQRPSPYLNPDDSTRLGVAGEGDVTKLARSVGTSLEALAQVLEAAGVVGPLVALFSLISSLVLLFPPFAFHFLNATQGKQQSKLLPLLARVIKRFGRPAPVARVGEKNGGRGGKQRERTRRVRGVASKPSGMVDKAVNDGVELEPAKRNALLVAVVEVLEGLAWRMPEDAYKNFSAFLDTDSAIATLLDPNQPIGLLTSTVRFLSSLACQPSLFHFLVGIKFYDASDVRGSKIPVFDRVGTLVVRNASKGSHQQMFTLDMCLISLVTSLTTKHDNAILFISQSSSLIPELLDKLFKDTRTLWEYDGQSVSDEIMSLLKLVVARLSATVHLFYYLACAPKSSINLTEFFTASTFLGLHDRFNVAFGTLSFASLPDWATGTAEGVRLTELGYLAQEIMEDGSPQEAEEIESCFTSHDSDGPDEEAGDNTMDEEEMLVGVGLGPSQGN